MKILMYLFLKSVDCLRIIRDFFGVVFKIEEFVQKKQEEDVEKENIQENISENSATENPKFSSKIMLFKCLGIGLINIARNTN